MEDTDFLLASQLQEQFDKESVSVLSQENDVITNSSASIYGRSNVPASRPLSVIDPSWETTDPNPDVHALFIQYNDQYFWGRLTGVEVKWSPRMTLCAGVCSYEGRGGLCSIRLSVPLLKLRPRKDLVETLLHEMIHAYLFVTENDRDRDGHGPNFQKHMHRINKASGAKITIYHDFHDEVDSYRQHWWRCNGPCKSRPPYYGWVKRAMNRAPSNKDWWWGDHARSCGGSYTKVKEPEGYGEKKKGKKEPGSSSKKEEKGTNGYFDIRSFWGKGSTLGSSDQKQDTTTASIARDKKSSTVTKKNGLSSGVGKQALTSNELFPVNKSVEEKNSGKQTTVQTHVERWGGGIWTSDENVSSPEVSPQKGNRKPSSIDFQGDKSVPTVNKPNIWTVIEAKKDKALKANHSETAKAESVPQESAGYVLGKSKDQGLSWLAKMRKEWAVSDGNCAKQSTYFVQQKTGTSSSVAKSSSEATTQKASHSGTCEELTPETNLSMTEGAVKENRTDSTMSENESFVSSKYSSHDSFHVSSCEEDNWPTPESYEVNQEKRKRTFESLPSSDEEDSVVTNVFKRSKLAVDSFTKSTGSRSKGVRAKNEVESRGQIDAKDTSSGPTISGLNSYQNSVNDENQSKQSSTHSNPYDTGISVHVQAGVTVSPGTSAQMTDTSENVPGHQLVVCPVCQSKVPENTINQHLDSCLC